MRIARTTTDLAVASINLEASLFRISFDIGTRLAIQRGLKYGTVKRDLATDQSSVEEVGKMEPSSAEPSVAY